LKRVLIFYSHFAPSFKGGGPVQSLVNLVENLKDDFLFFTVCSAYETGETKILDGVKPDEWNDYNANIKVFYSSKISYKILKTLFLQTNPDVVYINGIYLPFYNWLPLYIARQQNKKIILASRGMLQPAALAVKPLKKKIFLFLFKLSGLYKNVRWHATDRQEQIDIKRKMGDHANIEIAPNIPKTPLRSWLWRSKTKNELRLIYLSLIAEMKNLYLILETLKEIKVPIVFDIYGPIKDASYWQSCQPLMVNQIHKISYRGTVNPFEVQSKLQEYHAFILPTKGENFGHAIYEALSAGTIPIISPFTPWGHLQQHQAGITVDSWQINDWAVDVEQLVRMDQEEFSIVSQNSFALAKNYFEKNDFKSDYKNLFG